MATKDLFTMVQQKSKEQIKKKDDVTEAVAADAEAKAIEKIVSQRVWDRLTWDGYPGYPYYYPGYYHYPGDVAAKVAAITAYHDVINRAAAINAVAGMVAPSADMALKILEGATNPTATPPPDAQKPKDKAALQLNAEGVPVLIEPTLMKNEMSDVDLMQRDYILDGINGIDFVQTKTEGVPVLIEPTLMKNEMTEADLMQRDYIVDGINGIGFLQLNRELQRPIEDQITLQVKGVPITVNPESIMRDNNMAHAHLGLDLQVGIKTEYLNLL
jgi:NAD(P)H-hydrate repair Nnr-like enzyme with NAD(P)H-hydrate epimerase domain